MKIDSGVDWWGSEDIGVGIGETDKLGQCKPLDAASDFEFDASMDVTLEHGPDNFS